MSCLLQVQNLAAVLDMQKKVFDTQHVQVLRYDCWGMVAVKPLFTCGMGVYIMLHLASKCVVDSVAGAGRGGAFAP